MWDVEASWGRVENSARCVGAGCWMGIGAEDSGKIFHRPRRCQSQLNCPTFLFQDAIWSRGEQDLHHRVGKICHGGS